MGTIVIRDGEPRAIYSDGLLPYIQRARAEYGLPLAIERATRVEPDPDQTQGSNWFVDLTPAGGPLCHVDEDGNPFLKRQDAIDFELRWLEANWLLGEPQDAGTVQEEE